MHRRSEEAAAGFLARSGSYGKASAGHALAEAALVEKRLLELAELLVEEIAGQFNQADHHVGGNERVGVLDAFS